MDLEAETFLEPDLELRMIGVDRVGQNANGRPTVNLFQSFKNRPQECLVSLRLSHVINRKDHDTLDIRVADPLRGNQAGECAVHIKGVAWFGKIDQAIAVG